MRIDGLPDAAGGRTGAEMAGSTSPGERTLGWVAHHDGPEAAIVETEHSIRRLDDDAELVVVLPPGMPGACGRAALLTMSRIVVRAAAEAAPQMRRRPGWQRVVGDHVLPLRGERSTAPLTDLVSFGSDAARTAAAAGAFTGQALDGVAFKRLSAPFRFWIDGLLNAAGDDVGT